MEMASKISPLPSSLVVAFFFVLGFCECFCRDVLNCFCLGMVCIYYNGGMFLSSLSWCKMGLRASVISWF